MRNPAPSISCLHAAWPHRTGVCGRIATFDITALLRSASPNHDPWWFGARGVTPEDAREENPDETHFGGKRIPWGPAARPGRCSRCRGGGGAGCRRYRHGTPTAHETAGRRHDHDRRLRARGARARSRTWRGAARTLRETAARIAPLFPEGSGPADVDRPETGAKPIIWERWDDFVAESEALEAAAATVEAAALAGDAEAVTAAFSSLGNKGCGGCHQTFRRKLR